MLRWMVILALMLAPPALADVLAARTLPVGTVIAVDDLTWPADMPADAADSLIGQETRTIIYAGRPVTQSQLGQPRLIERNQLVTLTYEAGALSIQTEGRALAAGGAGDVIRVMNMASRTTVNARIREDGVLMVSAR